MNYESVLKDIQVGQRYVFYMEALDSTIPEVRNAATGAISSLSAELTQNVYAQKQQTDSMTRIDLALNFLKGAAGAERAKELRFFKTFQSKYPETKDLFKDLNIENIKEDYVSFIIKINQTLRGITNFKRSVNDELKRIERYNNSRPYTFKGKVKKQFKEEYEAALTNNGEMYKATDTVFTSDAKKRVEGLMNNRTVEGKLTSLVLQSAGKQLLNLDSKGISLNGSQLTILINLLTDHLYNMITQETGKISINALSTTGKKMAFDSEFQQYINNLLDAPNLSISLTSIAQQFGLYDNSLASIEADQKDIQKIQNKLFTAYKEMGGQDNFSTWLKQNKNKIDFAGMAKAATHVSVIGYYTGEDMSLDALLSAGIGGIMGGRKNATDDIQAGKLIFNIDLNFDQQQLVANYEEQLLNLQKEYFNKLNATSTIESFTQNTEQLQELRQKQQELLKQLLNKLNLGEDALESGILQHINIHDTIKGYSSAGGNYFSTKGGFSGAAFGTNLDNQLGIIASMDATGGLSQADIGFFKWAMINAGSLMIGAPNKKSLEDYFSIFVGFLMFNDATLMVQDAKSFMEQGLTNNTSEDLHLYDLNGVYVPSSYLLQKTWEQLSKIYTQMGTMTKNNQGTKATLHTYDGNYIKGDWPGTYALAASKTKLEMHFLGGFADLLESISDAMNNL